MLEDQVAFLLQKYLGNYVRGLSKEALKISVWNGRSSCFLFLVLDGFHDQMQSHSLSVRFFNPCSVCLILYLNFFFKVYFCVVDEVAVLSAFFDWNFRLGFLTSNVWNGFD